MKHLLSIESLSAEEIHQILDLTTKLKSERGHHDFQPLRGQCWAMIFSKSSTRTRVSFEVGIRELGGDVMFLSSSDIQLGRGEPIKDTARVMGRMLQGVVIRTFAQSDVEEFAQYSGIPTINALTDEEHPCQILADLFTIKEQLGSFEGKTICFTGDGACNVPRSWMWAAAKLNFNLVIAAPSGYQPPSDFLKKINCDKIRVTEDLPAAASGADVIYTDVWVSMGKESEAAMRLTDLAGYQLNDAIVKLAAPGALVMHCLPAYRDKEISESIFEAHAQTIFNQAENRLHVQKAVLSLLVQEPLI